MVTLHNWDNSRKTKGLFGHLRIVHWLNRGVFLISGWLELIDSFFRATAVFGFFKYAGRLAGLLAQINRIDLALTRRRLRLPEHSKKDVFRLLGRLVEGRVDK